MLEYLEWCQAFGWLVDQDFLYHINCVGLAALVENLLPRVGLDARELEFRVVGIHGMDLLLGRGPQNLDDLYQLVNARLTWEQWLSEQQLCNDAASGPHIDSVAVLGGTENELRCPVVA